MCHTQNNAHPLLSVVGERLEASQVTAGLELVRQLKLAHDVGWLLGGQLEVLVDYQRQCGARSAQKAAAGLVEIVHHGVFRRRVVGHAESVTEHPPAGSAYCRGELAHVALGVEVDVADFAWIMDADDSSQLPAPKNFQLFHLRFGERPCARVVGEDGRDVCIVESQASLRADLVALVTTPYAFQVVHLECSELLATLNFFSVAE